MTSLQLLRKSTTCALAAGVIAGAAVIAGSGVASAAPEQQWPTVANPWGGNPVPIEFRAVRGCLNPSNQAPGEPAEKLWLMMDDRTAYGQLSLDFRPAITTTTLELDWTNHDTGRSGHASDQGPAYHRELQADAGLGHITGTARITAGVLPLPSGSQAGSLNNSIELPVDIVIEPCR